MSELEYTGRFETTLIDGTRTLVIPGQRNSGMLIISGLFILPWTAGGILIVMKLLRSFEWSLLFALAFWAWGWFRIAGTLAWNFDGKDVVRVLGGKLEIRATAVGLRWTKRVPLDRVRDLRTAPENPDDGTLAAAGTIFIGLRRYGAVQFLNVWRPVHIAPGLYPEEGQAIVDALRAMLPGAAAEPLTRDNFPRG